jgi:hypothetical protein
MRYFVGLFLLFWLGGWLAGFIGAVSQLWSGKAPALLFVWLAPWTLGGAYVMYLVYRAFRPSVPESLLLTPAGITYDSGIPPLGNFYASRKDAWKSTFPKRTRAELDRRVLQSLRLRETGEGNRLTVDADGSRLDMAPSASEIEREWLYQFLANRYSLPPAQENVIAGRRSG